VSWLDLVLLAGGAGLLIVFLTSSSARLWAIGRTPAFLAFQVAGVLLAAWLLVGWAARGGGGGLGAVGLTPAETALLAQPATTVLVRSFLRSLLPILLGLALASAAGLTGALAVTTRHRGRWAGLGPAAVVLWTAPTFLLAILVQEFQAFVFGHTGLVLAAGYGDVSPVQVFWVAVVLAIRPAAYFFQQARVALDLDVSTEYVRTARAKGLAWHEVVRRHILPANSALILSAWVSSFRTMVAALPVVEFLFGYPGLGRVLVLSLGLTYGGSRGPVRVDLAIGLLAIMGVALAAMEALAARLAVRFDPRLRMLEAA